MYPVFIENISDNAKTADLRSVFNRHGDVEEVTIVSDHGFVTFAKVDDALEAIRKVDGQELLGKRLHVGLSKELEDHLSRNNRRKSWDDARGHHDRSPGRHFERGRGRGIRGFRGRGRGFREFRARGARRGFGPRADGEWRNRSPNSRRHSTGTEKRSPNSQRERSPMLKTYPVPDEDARYHHYKGSGNRNFQFCSHLCYNVKLSLSYCLNTKLSFPN